MMDFVSWDDCSIPNGSGKIYIEKSSKSCSKPPKSSLCKKNQEPPVTAATPLEGTLTREKKSQPLKAQGGNFCQNFMNDPCIR
jgi:hypothetical protein